MTEWLALILVVMMLAAALAVVLVPSLVGAIAASSAVSLVVAVIFVVLRAPDVAMTEAAVGAGLSAAVLGLGVRRLGLWKLNEGKKDDA